MNSLDRESFVRKFFTEAREYKGLVVLAVWIPRDDKLRSVRNIWEVFRSISDLYNYVPGDVSFSYEVYAWFITEYEYLQISALPEYLRSFEYILYNLPYTVNFRFNYIKVYENAIYQSPS